jgi:HEAT repeat protein
MDSTTPVIVTPSLSTQAIRMSLQSLHSARAERDQAIAALRSADRESTVDSLVRLLGDPDSEVRCDAAEALMRVDATRGTEHILSLLSDPDSGVRWHTCGLLYDRGDARASERLTEVLLNDPEGEVRLFAADALRNVGDPAAIARLSHAAEFDQGTDREGRTVADAAREAIIKIQSRRP